MYATVFKLYTLELALFYSFIKWNFSKFLLNRKGEPYKRYGPNEEPEVIVQ